MKKLFATLLAIALLCTLSVSAFADEEKEIKVTGDNSKDLQVQYSAGTRQHAYAASITWENMVFTYHTAAQEWDTETMTWKDKEGEKTGWNSKTVTVSNRSSDKINVTFGYTPKEDAVDGVEDFCGYTLSVIEGSNLNSYFVRQNLTKTIEVAAATAGENGNYGTATEIEFTIMPDGTYTGTSETPVTVGTITLTLS